MQESEIKGLDVFVNVEAGDRQRQILLVPSSTTQP